MTYSDTELRKFLDGDLDAETAKAIEAELAINPELEQRLMGLDTIAAPVKKVMQTLPNQSHLDALQKTLRPIDTPVQRRWAWPAIAASVVIGLFAGWVAHSSLSPAPKEGWRMEVARYQALYVDETVEHIQNNTDQVSAQFLRASKAIDLNLPQSNLAQITDLRLARAQILGFKGKPLIQIAYEGPAGLPVALCIIHKTGGSAKKDTVYETLVGLSSATWETSTHQFLLIGGTQDQDIETWANELQPMFNNQS